MDYSLPSTDDWPLTPTEEVKILLARWYNHDAIAITSEELDLPWFEVNDVTYSMEETALEIVVAEKQNHDD